MTFADNIKARRFRAGLTQTHAADLAGVSQSYWSELEAGVSRPGIDVLVRAAHALGCEPGELLNEKNFTKSGSGA